MIRRTNPTTRRAVTLLELILALALAVIVLGAIGWAIQLHMRSLDTRRTDVEQAQLARAVLKIIADDLRSAVAFNTVDFSEAATLAVGGAIPGLDEEFDEDGFEDEPPPEGEDPAGDDAEDPTDSAEDKEEEEPRDLSADITPSTVPGIYGNQYQLQIDVSRLPRIEDFDPVLQDSTGNLRDLPSDVKTVAYYLQAYAAPADDSTSDPATGLGLGDSVTSSSNAAQGAGSGLVRRALDRAATQYAVETADTSRLDRVGELLAPEVVALEFRYFDGQQWQMTWDSEAAGGLPVAVEVAIAIADQRKDRQADEPAGPASLADAQQQPRLHVYRQVIRIPSGEPTFDELEGVETDDF